MRVADDLGVGTILAGFRVESLLGHGGMSTVYVAEDLHLRRRVALKVLAVDLAADEDFRERFLRESELAASIDHPHIVPIYEAGESGGVLFIAMRYVAGGDLKARLREGRLELGEATSILAQVAGALDAAHVHGLVHRDVKPSNILLDPGSRPDGSDHAYLADFGVTTRIADGPGADGRALVGTIDYVAPEQIAGGAVDGRADLYSLGCVLYQCLVGEPPFRRDTDVEVVFAHLDADPPAASERNPELPAPLDAVIAKALAKEPGERYPTCRALTGVALSIAVEEARRHLSDVATRTAAGRLVLSDAETELAGRVVELQVTSERARSLSGRATAPRDECPFKGLDSYRLADAESFFGRERLIAELVARLAGATFLGIVGPSGSGKSSVLHAGLIPALAGGVLPGSQCWRPVLIRPGEQPIPQLQRMLEAAADEPLLLVVDQLEELFTAYDSNEEMAAFADALAWGPAVVVVALRADFYGHVAAYPALAERLGANNVLVGPMRESELRRAVELPAARVGLRVEPELVDRLVEDVTGEPGALPLLSTALVELWQRRRNDTLTLASYVDSGGVRGAIARLAEDAYARVPDEHQALVRAIMLRLVAEGHADAAVRRRAPLAELDPYREDVAGVLAALVDGRLVTVSQDGVELAHEAVLREWPRLRGWIEEDAAGRRVRGRLTDAAIEWDAADRDPSGLYRGARLAAAVDWTTDHATELNALEREFIESSRDAAQRETRRVRRSNRRLRVSLAAVAVLLVAALVGGTLAVVAADRARNAETAQLGQRLGAQALVEEYLDLGLLLARQAVAVSDTPQTRASLLTVLAKAPAAIGMMHADGAAMLVDVALSPDGKTLAFLGDDAIHFFDTRTYQRIGEPLTVSAWPYSLAYSPDGSVLVYGGASAGGRGYLRMIDPHSRAELATAPIQEPPMTVAFTDDGNQLVVIGLGRVPVVRIHAAATLNEVAPPIELAGLNRCDDGSISCWGELALTPDGRSMLTLDAGELRWWDLETGQRTRSLSIEPGRGPLAISPDGLRAAVGTDNGIQLIDLSNGASRTAAGGVAASPVWVRFSPDGATVASGNGDGTVTLWDAGSARVGETLRGHGAIAHKGVFSADGTTLYTVAGDWSAIAWDLSGTRGIRRTFTLPGNADSAAPASTYPFHPDRFSPDGTLIAVGLNGQGIALWDATDLTPAGATLMETGGEVKALTFSPDGHTLAAAAASGTVTLWDVTSRSLRHKPIHTTPTMLGFLPGLAFTPDGSILLTSSGSGVQTWDVATGTGLGRLTATADVTSDLSLSADGTLAAFARGSRGGVEVWDVARRTPVTEVPGEPGTGEQSAVALSPDGRTLAVGGYSLVVRLWDIGTGQLLHELDQGGPITLSLEFSPDGRILATGGTLWDVATGTRIGPNLAAGTVPMTDPSPDGRRLLLTTPEGLVAVWDIDPESWAQRACALANRTLTTDEWDRFVPGRPYEPACAS